MMREVFNEVIMHDSITPEAPRKMTIKEISKKGDEERAENYRPICTLPTLHKEFSTLLYNRLYSKLDRRQPPDQEGFRRSFQTLDHLATFRLLEQKSREWSVKIWIATVDFSKASDTIRHDPLGQALARFEVDAEYISLFKKK